MGSISRVPRPPDTGEAGRSVPGRKLSAHVDGLYAALGKDFLTARVNTLTLGFDGIAGDVHRGMTRRSGGREPWYARGSEIRNDRQLSLVAPDELAAIATAMELAEVKPEWLGANLLIGDIERFSLLPAGTKLFFEGGAALTVGGRNSPCRVAGRAIAEHVGMADVQAGALLFPKVAKRLRGLVASVEKPGTIVAGEAVSVRVPEQWIYA